MSGLKKTYLNIFMKRKLLPWCPLPTSLWHISLISSELSNFVTQAVKLPTFCTESSHCPWQLQQRILTSTHFFSSTRSSTHPQMAPSHSLRMAPPFGCTAITSLHQHIIIAKSSSPLTGSTHFTGCICSIVSDQSSRLDWIHQKPSYTSQLCGIICSHFHFYKKTNHVEHLRLDERRKFMVADSVLKFNQER